MTLAHSTGSGLTRDIDDELRRQGEDPEDYKPTVDRARFRPKPEVQDVLALKDWLLEFYKPLHEGHQTGGLGASTESQRYTGIIGLRQLRYGQDTTAAKLYGRLNNDIRVRSMQSHKLIFQVRSLLARNPMQVSVPAASGSDSAIKRATKETRWANELARAVERRAVFSPFQESDDAQCEGFGGYEVYLRDAWDRIDFDPAESELDDAGNTTRDYDLRIDEAKRSTGLPFGIRALDPLSTLIDPSDDGEGINAVIFVEKKRARPLLERYREKDQELYERVKVSYGDSGFDPYGMGEVEVLRYFDDTWYVCLVNGVEVENAQHGLPGVPVFPAWGFVTSAKNMGDKFQGVAYALQVTEALANDALTQELDSQLTYSRVKLVAEAAADANQPDQEVIDLSGNALLLLPPGYALKNAFADFRGSAPSPGIGIALGLGQTQATSPVLSGQAPAADSSGYSLNLMTQNAIGPYKPLLDNKATAWGQTVDFCRRVIKETLREGVPLPIVGSDGPTRRMEWLELGPGDITDIPCVVEVDPTSDLEKIALSKWLSGGVEGKAVPLRLLQERGYGADDASAWDDEIIRDEARAMLRGELVKKALVELLEDMQFAQGPNSGLVDMYGQPLPPSGVGPGMSGGGMPLEPVPSAVGVENITGGPMAGGNAGMAGQMPLGQPTMGANQGMVVPGA